MTLISTPPEVFPEREIYIHRTPVLDFNQSYNYVTAFNDFIDINKIIKLSFLIESIDSNWNKAYYLIFHDGIFVPILTDSWTTFEGPFTFGIGFTPLQGEMASIIENLVEGSSNLPNILIKVEGLKGMVFSP